MSPHRQLSYSSHRQPTKVQDVFVGLALLKTDQSKSDDKRNLEYTVVIHDGTGVIESETYNIEMNIKEGKQHAEPEEASRISEDVLQKIGRVQREKGMNVCFWIPGAAYIRQMLILKRRSG